MNLNVKREAADGLSVQEWSFYNIDYDLKFVLGGYRVQRRATKRHKFTTAGRYERTNTRDSNILVDAVPLPEDVVAEVRQTLIDSITISK